MVGPQAMGVLHEGRSSWNEELLLIMERYGYPEETYFTFFYSPVVDEASGVGGVFCAVTEDTARVLGRRRLRTLRELATATVGAKDAIEACQRAAEALGTNPHDLPFVLIYLFDAAGASAQLVGTTGVASEASGARELLAHVEAHLELGRLRSRIEQERAALENLFQQTPVPVAVLRGPELVYDLANPAYLNVVGGRDIVGKPLLKALPGLQGQGFDTLLHGVMQTGVAEVGHEILVKLDRQGSGAMEDTYWTFIYASLQGDNRQVERVVVICNDVTESVRARRQLECLAADLEQRVAKRTAELQQAHDDLRREMAERQRMQEALFQQEKLAALGTLLANVAHELNNPLAVAAMQLDILQEAGAFDAWVENLTTLRQAVERCKSVVQSFLSLVRQQGARAPCRIAPGGH